MPVNITEIRSQMRGDGARPNLFEVSLVFPTSIISDLPGVSEKMTFMCRSAEIPGVTQNIAPISYMGREIKLAGNKTFTEWTTTIYNDSDYLVRRAIEKWSNAINSHEGNIRYEGIGGNGTAPVLDYTVNAQVVKLGLRQGERRVYAMINCWPTDIQPIQQDWGQNDSIEEFTVTWAYDYWQSIDTDGNQSPLNTFG